MIFCAGRLRGAFAGWFQPVQGNEDDVLLRPSTKPAPPAGRSCALDHCEARGGIVLAAMKQSPAQQLEECHIGPGHSIARKPRNGGSASPPIPAAGYDRGRPSRGAARQVVALNLPLGSGQHPAANGKQQRTHENLSLC
jgi:hypothetical protein